MGDIATALGGSFSQEVDNPATGWVPLPPAWYTVQIDNAEVKNTKKGDGIILKLAFINYIRFSILK